MNPTSTAQALTAVAESLNRLAAAVESTRASAPPEPPAPPAQPPSDYELVLAMIHGDPDRPWTAPQVASNFTTRHGRDLDTRTVKGYLSAGVSHGRLWAVPGRPGLFVAPPTWACQ